MRNVAIDDDRSHLLDRSSPMPLWAQLHADLIERLNAGEFGPEFPSEQALTASYGVSRHTVREALRQLRQDKILIAQRGRPTQIAQPAARIRTHNSGSSPATIAASKPPASRNARTRTRESPPQAAAEPTGVFHSSSHSRL